MVEVSQFDSTSFLRLIRVARFVVMFCSFYKKILLSLTLNRIAVSRRISGVYVDLFIQFSVQHVGYVRYVGLDSLHCYFLYLIFDNFIYCVLGRGLGYFRYGAMAGEHIAYVLDYLRHGHLF